MVNVVGTLNLFEAARDAGRPVVSCMRARRRSGDPRRHMDRAALGGRSAKARDALRSIQAGERRERASILFAERDLECRAATLDRLWRRPRPRHDRRSDACHSCAGEWRAVSDPSHRLHGPAVCGRCCRYVHRMPAVASRRRACLQSRRRSDPHGRVSRALCAISITRASELITVSDPRCRSLSEWTTRSFGKDRTYPQDAPRQTESPRPTSDFAG